MRSIRTTITAITIVVILTSILSVFAASYRIIQSETDQNSVGMMNLIDEDTQKSLEKYFESIEQSVEVASNIAIEDMDSVFLAQCGALRIQGMAAEQTPEQRDALDQYLDTYCQKIQQYFTGVADCTQGVTSYYYCINPEISQKVPGFFYYGVFGCQTGPSMTSSTFSIGRVFSADAMPTQCSFSLHISSSRCRLFVRA